VGLKKNESTKYSSLKCFFNEGKEGKEVDAMVRRFETGIISNKAKEGLAT